MRLSRGREVVCQTMTIKTEEEHLMCVSVWYGLHVKADPTAEDLAEIADLEACIDEYERLNPLD